MTYPHLPTAPYRVLGLSVTPRHGKHLLCLATDPASLEAMQATLRDGCTDYRLSWHDGAQRLVTRHEVRQRGTVRTWEVIHEPVPVSERLRELESAADEFEPMDEWKEAA